MGAIARVDAAEVLLKTILQDGKKKAINAVKGAALAVVRLRIQQASFHQDKMIESNAVEAIPGNASGSNT